MAKTKEPGERKTQISLYLRNDFISELHAWLGDRNRNDWLTEAIKEKIERERAESGQGAE